MSRSKHECTLEFDSRQQHLLEMAGLDTCDSELLKTLLLQHAARYVNGVVRRTMDDHYRRRPGDEPTVIKLRGFPRDRS